MPVRSVLVVDDSKTELLHLAGLLRGHGLAVRTAENADQALQCLAEQRPDLILMDVVMPGQNGFAFTRALQRDPAYADIPIFLCTSKRRPSDRLWGLRQGARDYLTKPVDAAQLHAKIAALG